MGALGVPVNVEHPLAAGLDREAPGPADGRGEALQPLLDLVRRDRRHQPRLCFPDRMWRM